MSHLRHRVKRLELEAERRSDTDEGVGSSEFVIYDVESRKTLHRSVYGSGPVRLRLCVPHNGRDDLDRLYPHQAARGEPAPTEEPK